MSVDPTWYFLNTQASVVDASQYTLEYTEYSAWETGFTGQLSLMPQVDCQHWELSIDSNREITAVSSAILMTEGDNSYAITHDENNMRLFVGTAYNFGIQGVNNEDPLELSNVELTAVELAYHLADDEDANGIPDYLEFIGGGNIVDPTPTPVPTEMPTATPTEESTDTPTEEPSGTPTPTVEPAPTSVEDPYLDLEDRDGDGLLDYQEIMYITDPDNPDTDGDGLLDGDEINILTNPRVVDTDGNGISDFEEDYDGDGIHNGGEYATGTCMFAYDSDYDGINDYNEVYFYGINPNNEDSDFDGIKDGDEVILGLNPGSNDSNGDGITDDYVMFEQSLVIEPIADDHPHEITSVQISGSISGLITSNTTIEDTYNRDVYCTGVYGRVGVPINIESEGYFDSMTLTISYDDSVLGETDENNLGVLWYDEETGFFVVQEQTVVDTTNNTVTLVLNHFSTYILVDLNKWNNLQITPTTSTTGSIRTVTWHTRGVYYDAFPIYEQNEAGEWIDTGRFYGGTIAPERYENTAWNEYLTSHPNDVRLETLNIGHFIVFGGLNYTYTWSVYTNESTDGDNDHDGLPDNLEISGILGTNGEIYYSNPDSLDSDGDTLLDGEEYGNLYLLSRDNDGRLSISLNNTVIYESEEGSISPDSTYFYFYRYTLLLGYGQCLGVACVKSDPMKQYTDEDNARDDEDARPMTLNEDYIYIFTNQDFFYDAQLSKVLYESLGYNVCLYKFTDADSFETGWNGIGLSFDYYFLGTKPYGDKYYYNAKYVTINTHGSQVSLTLGTNDELSDRLYIDAYRLGDNPTDYRILRLSRLPNKHIESLNLYACSCGARYNNFKSLAECFLESRNNIEQVIAADTLFFNRGEHFYFMSYGEPITCSVDEYTQFENNDNSAGGLTCFLCGDYTLLDNPEGFLSFTRNNDDIVISNVYEDDVYIGVMYILPNSEGEGYIVYSYTPGEDCYHDPIVERGLL